MENLEEMVKTALADVDLHKGWMCIDNQRNCMAFCYDAEILMDGYETIQVTCDEDIDIDCIQGYILNDDNTITWSDDKWNKYQRDVVEPNNIRVRREEECFGYINRGDAWYNMYVNTPERVKEFNEWYQAWLNAPQTRVIPIKPEWID